jgi:predicted permease
MTLLADLRLAARALLKNPGHSALAVLALGLGIGLTSTTWSVVHGTALRGLPFDHAEQLMALDRRVLAGSTEGVPTRVHDLADWRERQHSFEGLAAFFMMSVNLSGAEGQPERSPGALLTVNTFDLLRVRPLLGRAFLAGDDRPGALPVAILGYGLWQDRFGGDPNVVGQTVRVNGVPTTVVGVMPRMFRFPIGESIWLPLAVDPLLSKRGEGPGLGVFGRLRAGTSLEVARAEFTTLAKELEARYPETHRGTGVVIKPYDRMYLASDEGVVPGLYAMLATVFAVLLIACANVSNLLLARAVVRTRELAVRAALGASRLRLVSLVLAESSVIALGGGALGVALAFLGIRWFREKAMLTNPPFWLEFKLDGAVLLFVLGAAVLSALVAGVVPAWRSSRPNMHEVLCDAARGTSSLRLGRFSRALVITELALSCALLLPAGMMTRSIVNLREFNVGFAVDLLTARVMLPRADYPDNAKRLQFFEELTWYVGLFGTLFVAFGVAALLLAVVGLYGVVAFSTGQRAHQIGIRMALGATTRDVISLVMQQGVWQLGLGTTLGVAAGLGFSRVMARFFFRVTPFDPATVATVLIVLGTTTLVACLFPARRAARTEPSVALRDQ